MALAGSTCPISPSIRASRAVSASSMRHTSSHRIAQRPAVRGQRAQHHPRASSMSPHGAELGFGSHRIKLGRDARQPASRPSPCVAKRDSAFERRQGPGRRLHAQGQAPRQAHVGLGFRGAGADRVPRVCRSAAMPPTSNWRCRRMRGGPPGSTATSVDPPARSAWPTRTSRTIAKPAMSSAFVAVRDNACMTCHKDDAHQHIKVAGATARLDQARGEPTGFAGFQRAVAHRVQQARRPLRRMPHRARGRGCYGSDRPAVLHRLP